MGAGFFDTAQIVMGGALRGLGWLRTVTFTYLATSYLIMLPIGCAFAFYLSQGVYGMWCVFLLGPVLASIVYAIVLAKMDYEAQAVEISARLDQKPLESSASTICSEPSVHANVP